MRLDNSHFKLLLKSSLIGWWRLICTAVSSNVGNSDNWWRPVFQIIRYFRRSASQCGIVTDHTLVHVLFLLILLLHYLLDAHLLINCLIQNIPAEDRLRLLLLYLSLRLWVEVAQVCLLVIHWLLLDSRMLEGIAHIKVFVLVFIHIVLLKAWVQKFIWLECLSRLDVLVLNMHPHWTIALFTHLLSILNLNYNNSFIQNYIH